MRKHAPTDRHLSRALFDPSPRDAKSGHESENFGVWTYCDPPPGCRIAVSAIRFGETFSLSGLRPSIGGVGDAYDNALATTIGLYKNECIRADSPFRRGPLRKLADAELITPTTSPGTTSSASCIAWDASHPPKQKPNTTINWTPANRPAHRTSRVHETSMKLGM